MSTWTFKALAFCILLGPLAGCDEAETLAFAAELESIGSGGGARQVSQVELAGRKITLTAPEGYCIDRRSVRRLPQSSFALIARCDTLGVRGSFQSKELALITVTTAPNAPDTPNPSLADLERSFAPAKVLERRSGPDLPLIRLASGAQAKEGINQEHWRGAFVLNGQLVAVALYSPDSAKALRNEGAALLRELTRKTKQASASPAAALITPKVLAAE